MTKRAETHAPKRHAEDEFVPINLASLRLDHATQFDVYFQPSPDQPYVLYAERNVQFTEAVRRRLVDSQVDKVYIRASQMGAYSRYIEEHLAEILADTAIDPEHKSDLLYTSVSGVAESLLMSPDSRENLQRSRETVKHTVNFMLSDKQGFARLLKALSSTYQVYTHSVNVVTYAVALAQRTGRHDAATLRDLAIGALLHDVGMSRISPAIVGHPGTLTQEQWEEIKHHPSYGFEMLDASGHVGEIALDIVRHHHEKLGGGGYPDGLKHDEISPFVRLVSIADVFDAMTTDRPFQKARPTFTALSQMRTLVVHDLDPDLFRAFVSMMGNPEQ